MKVAAAAKRERERPRGFKFQFPAGGKMTTTLSAAARSSRDSGLFSLSSSGYTYDGDDGDDDTISLPDSLRKEYQDLSRGIRRKSSYWAEKETVITDKKANEDDDDDETASIVSSNFKAEEKAGGCPDDDDDSEDSGIETVEEVASTAVEVCGGADECFCFKIRSFLKRMADRSLNLLELDDHFRDRYDAQASEGQVKRRERLRDLANCNFDPYPTLASESFRYAGERDKFGRIHGRGTVYFPNGRKFSGSFFHGVRYGLDFCCFCVFKIRRTTCPSLLGAARATSTSARARASSPASTSPTGSRASRR